MVTSRTVAATAAGPSGRRRSGAHPGRRGGRIVGRPGDARIVVPVSLPPFDTPTPVAAATLTPEPPTQEPSTPEPQTPEPPTPDPVTPEPTRFGSEEDQQSLLDLLPATVSECNQRSLLGREIAAVYCSSPGSELTDYGLYATWTEIERDWFEYLDENGLAPDSSTDCADGVAGESQWNFEAEPDVTLGRIACYKHDQFGWVITWTDNRNNTWGFVLRTDGDYATTWEAWSDAITVP